MGRSLSKGSPWQSDFKSEGIEMIAAIFASIGLVCGYLFARADDCTRLGRMKYAVGFAITFAILGEVLGIALDRFLPPL
jgi:hypothetical protein